MNIFAYKHSEHIPWHVDMGCVHVGVQYQHAGVEVVLADLTPKRGSAHQMIRCPYFGVQGIGD